MIILPRDPLTQPPSLIQRLQHILTQLPLLKVVQILHQLLVTTRPDNHLVSILILQLTVMHHPPQRNLTLPQLPFRTSQLVKRAKELVVPVPCTVHLALHFVRVEARPGLEGCVVGVAVVAVRKPAAGEGIEGVEGHVVVAQAREEFGFDGAVESVVDALVDAGEGVRICAADFAYCGDYFALYVSMRICEGEIVEMTNLPRP
jgi:hypothetical protein